MTRTGLVMLVLLGSCAALPAQDVPKAADPRLVVELFAASPDIVHPVSTVCDRKGRLLVIESHTHFRPKDYKGPKFDRIRILEDTDGDGKADKFTTFYEGTSATMDIALHPDGWVYVATRNEVLRLRDSKGDGVADEKQRIAFLDTKGDYPHNGLSGLSFDARGNLYFGMGENLGADYKLIGSDGTTIADGGEGGSIFHCTADGKKLRRVCTGFWNPFGVCTDIFGRVFAVDNDPDAMPPCRMTHIVEGGDYGYQFRYGRTGRHPFQAWNGQLPGTLPMMTGVGEAPCEIISYESFGLPKEYLGQLLVASWADHRIERYPVVDKGASVVSDRKPFIQGGKDFRPVGIAVAPDGSLFISDWVLRDYNLHGKGAVWHVRMKEPNKVERPTDSRQALLSLDRDLREAAAKKLADQGEAGRVVLREHAKHEDVRIRAAAITALIVAEDGKLDLHAVAEKDPVLPLRALAVRTLAERRDASKYTQAKEPAIAFEAMSARAADPALLPLLADPDPFLRHAAIQRLAKAPELLDSLDPKDPAQRVGVLLARRAAGKGEKALPRYLTDPDEEVRFLAAKWIADQKLVAFRPQVMEALKDPKLSVRLYFAFTTTLARLDNQDVSDARMADYFFTRLTDGSSSPALKIAALQLVPTSHKKLTLDVLGNLLKDTDAAVRKETVRTLSEHPNAGRFPLLLQVAQDKNVDAYIRADAIVGLAERAQEQRAALLAFVDGPEQLLAYEALRALTGVKLEHKLPDSGDLARRVNGQPFAKDRPKADDTAAWLKRLEGPASADTGRRIFFHPRLANCARCHRVDGHGADVGPDLSGIGRTERRHIVESILQPDLIVAPHYQNWAIVTDDGKSYTGLLVHTHLDEYTYVDPKGERFKLNTRNIVDVQPIPTSIMPTGLQELLTDQEMRDLLAFLTTRK